MSEALAASGRQLFVSQPELRCGLSNRHPYRIKLDDSRPDRVNGVLTFEGGPVFDRGRRDMLQGVISLVGFATLPFPQAISSCPAPAKDDRPRPEALSSGDFLWPKKKNAIVPFSSRPGEATPNDRRLWEQQKATFLAALTAKTSLSADEQELFKTLQQLTYDEFVALYLSDEDPNNMSLFGSISPFYVGHVGIVQVDGGIPYVVEAVMGKGVQRISYADWTRQRNGELVWHAKLEKLDKTTQSRIAEAAAAYVGRPYDFWNFDLDDDSGFYCSKLAWLSVWQAASIALDGNSNPQRRIWFSPKRMMKSDALCLLNRPASYTFR